MKVPFSDFSRMHNPLEKEINEALRRVVRKGDFILGDAVKKFERDFAAYCEVDHAVGISNGTDALEIALKSCGVVKGDEVITVPNTFIATAAAISAINAKPVFVDVLPDSANMDPSKIQDAVTDKTKAIIPVHLYGQPADMNAILNVAKRNSLKIIEDACQAHGAVYKGRRVGGLADAAAFSFYPGKNLGAFGDAGMLVTNDGEIAEKAKMLRNYGQSGKNRHIMFCGNKRLDSIQAAILNVKLPSLGVWNQSRKNTAKKLIDGLDGMLDLPLIAPDRNHVYHLFVVGTSSGNERDKLQEFMNGRDIQTGLHYPIPVHLQEAYSFLGLNRGSFPVAEKLSETGLTLPMFPYMRDEEISHIIDTVKDFYRK